MHGFWLLIHLLGVIVWVGGMFFALYCLRPVAHGLPPPQRVPLMIAVFERFFGFVIVALIMLWVSGLILLRPGAGAGMPIGWHLMIGAAIIMTVVFAVIRWRIFPLARQAAKQSDLPSAGAALERIRRLVLVNLVLGGLAIAAVKLLA